MPPSLHIQYNQNKTIEYDPTAPTVLQTSGPCVQITVGLNQTMAGELLKQGKQIPKPISGIALIDTGASISCINNEIAIKLGLPVIDKVTVSTPSHHASEHNIYPISLEITGTPIKIDIAKTIGAVLDGQGLMMLIGRDVLKFGTLFYNGVTGQISFSV